MIETQNSKRYDLEERTLKFAKNVRIFKDVHVSGHGALEDHRDLLELIKPEHIIPIHVGEEKAEMLAEFAASLGFKNSHVSKDGKRWSF